MLPFVVAGAGFTMMYGVLKAEEWYSSVSRDEFTPRHEPAPFTEAFPVWVERAKSRFANPFGPYDRMDVVAGGTVLAATYFTQAAMILWGPPPVKAVGVAWVAFPMGDPFAFGLGVKYNPFG
jgi:hypothetical protein